MPRLYGGVFPKPRIQSKHPPVFPTYDDLPSDWETSDHYYFYGWAVTNDMLQNYLSSIKVPKERDGNDLGISIAALFYMRRELGFNHLNPVYGKVDAESAAKGRVWQREEGVYLELVTIGCTRSKRLFRTRPTVEQLDRLIEIFGEKPRWFEDFFTKDNFGYQLL